MARNDGVDRTIVRNQPRTESTIADAEAHNERQKTSYRNEDIIPERSPLNIHFKTPTGSYTQMFRQMEQEGVLSTRGLKQDAVHYGELVFDVNSAYFHRHGGYDYARAFYAEAYKAAVDMVGGEQFILSAVMHADERNTGMSKAIGYDVWHYHLHVVYVPIVEKQILWTKRCKDPALVGTVKETIMQVSHSKKWASRPVLDVSGNPMRTKGGKIVLRKSYSVLQDQFHDHMFAAGFTDVQRGERGSAEEHLTTVQFKVMKEEETLTTLWAEQQRAQQAAAHAEAQRQEAEHEAETAQKKLDRLTKSASDVAAFMQKTGSADALLPEPGVLESARGYRTGKALPLVSKLLRKLKEVYALWLKERQANAGLMQETAYWKRQAQTNEAAREKAARLDKLTRILGVDEIDRLLTPHRNSARAPRKAQEQDRSIY